MSASRRKQYDYTVTPEHVQVERLAWDGENKTVVETVQFPIADVPAELINGEGKMTLAAYGLSQILQDRTSNLDADERLVGMQDTFKVLCGGEWKVARASTAGERKATIDPHFAAGFSAYLASKGKDVTVTTATVLLQSMEADERKALRTHADISPFIVKSRESAEDAANDIDLSDLLG